MIRLFGILKLMVIFAFDFIALYTLTDDVTIATVIIGVIALYVWLGGYISLLKEGAVSSEKLPLHEKIRLDAARRQLAEDVKDVSQTNIARIKIYLLPDNNDMNATAYGANCVSVTRGTFNNADPVTLVAILCHEVSHILHYDAECNRAVFASVTLLLAAFSIMSATVLIVIFLLFLILNCFRSWLGVLAFKGTAKITGGFFSLLQRGIVAIYRSILGLVSRHAEYRCDRYSCSLGYGIQLAHFLSIAAPSSQRQWTLTEALYRSHPPTERRIARLEEQLYNSKSVARRRYDK